MVAPERSRSADVVALSPPRGPAPVPAHGTVLLDARGTDRALRVSWHDEDGLVVLSVWRGGECTATFRLEASDIPALVDTLVTGLDRVGRPFHSRRDAG